MLLRNYSLTGTPANNCLKRDFLIQLKHQVRYCNAESSFLSLFITSWINLIFDVLNIYILHVNINPIIAQNKCQNSPSTTIPSGRQVILVSEVMNVPMRMQKQLSAKQSHNFVTSACHRALGRAQTSEACHAFTVYHRDTHSRAACSRPQGVPAAGDSWSGKQHSRDSTAV